MPRVGLPIPASRLPSPFRQRSTADLLRATSLASPLAFHLRPIKVVVYDLTSEHCCWEDLPSGMLGAGSGAKCRESRFGETPRQRRKCAEVRNRPVSMMGVYQPPPDQPRRPSSLRLGPHGLPALQTQRQAPKKPPVLPRCLGSLFLPRSSLSQSAAPRANNNRPRRPAFRCRPWSCPASVPIAGNNWSAKRGNYQEITVIRKVGFAPSGFGRGDPRLTPVNIG